MQRSFQGSPQAHEELRLSLPERQTYGSAIISEVVSIYDADTFTVNIAGWPRLAGARISVGVRGIDTPELRGKCAQETAKARKATQAAVAILRAGKHIELRNMGRDKYFRILADVYVDGVSLAEALLNQELARPYDGGKKSSWCN